MPKKGKTPKNGKKTPADEEALKAEQAAKAAALKEQRRLVEEARLHQQMSEQIPVEVPRYGTSDVRGMLVRTFQDLYAEPNLGAPDELPAPPPPVVEEEPEEPKSGKGKKDKSSRDKTGKKTGKKKGKDKAAEEEAQRLKEEEEALAAAEAALQEPIIEMSQEERELRERVLARTDGIQKHLEGKIERVTAVEDFYLQHIRASRDKELDRRERLESHGLMLGVDVPKERSFLNLGQTVEAEGLVNLDKIVKDTTDTIIGDTLPRVQRVPPRGRAQKSKQAAAQEEAKRLKDEQIEAERLAKLAKNAKQRQTGKKVDLSPEEKRARKERLRKRRMVLKDLMPERDTTENKRILRNMRTKLEFLKNPRFQEPPVVANPSAPIAGQMAYTKGDKKGKVVSPFILPEPSVVCFDSYNAGQKYTMKVLLRNRTKIGRRVRLFPLKSRIFQTPNLDYRMAGLKNGMIAPGMCVELTVHFTPDGLADFDDMVVIGTEAGRLEIPLLGRRIRPALTLAGTLDCGVCFVDDYAMYKFPCLNRGNNSGRYWVIDPEVTIIEFLEDDDGYCTKEFVRKLIRQQQILEEEDEDATEITNNCVTVGTFTVKPAYFEVYPRSMTDFEILYQPEEAIKHEHPLVIVCDNTQLTNIVVKGHCWNVQLEITGVEGVKPAVSDADSTVDSLIFRDMAITGFSTKAIEITNHAPLPVPFHWGIDDLAPWFPTQNELGENERDVFFIKPSQGIFPPRSKKKFVFTFIPQDLELYRKQAQLWVDLSEKEKTRSLKWGDFSLQGCGISTVMTLSPPTLLFTDPGLLIDRPHTKKVKITNESDAKATFAWGNLIPARSHTREDFKGHGRTTLQSHLSGASLTIVPSSGELLPGESVELDVTLSFTTLDQVRAEVACEISHGDTLFMRIDSKVRGPEVRVAHPTIDFGLINIGVPNVFKEEQFTLINHSDGPASFAFCQRGEEAPVFLPDSWDGRILADDDDFQDLAFDPPRGILGPKQLLNCTVRYTPHKEWRLRSHIECHVKHSGTQFIAVRGEVQAPKVCISPIIMDLDTMFGGDHSYVSVERILDLQIENLTNLTAVFNFENFDVPEYLLEFTPQTGDLAGKEKRPIRVRFIPRMPMKMNQAFGCDVEGVENPVPFKLRTTIHPLEISYHVEDIKPKEAINPHGRETPALTEGDDSPNDPLSLLASQLPGNAYHGQAKGALLDGDQLKGQQASMERERLLNLDKIYPYVPNATPTIDFGELNPIFQRQTKRLIIRNHTAIPTRFDLRFEQFACPEASEKLIEGYVQTLEKDSAIIIDQINSNDFGTATKNNETKDNGDGDMGMSTTVKVKPEVTRRKKKPKRVKHPVQIRGLLSNTHETTERFQSDKGKEFVGKNIRSTREEQFLALGKGVAMFCTPACGPLAPFEVKEVTVVIFNDMCGTFRDRLCCNIDTLPVTKLPVQLSIYGSPLSFAPTNAGMLFAEGPETGCAEANPLSVPSTTPQPRLCWNPVPCESDIYKKRVRIENHGPIDVRLHWHMFDTRSVLRDRVTELDIGLTTDDNGELTTQTKINAYLPVEAKDFVLKVEPEDIVVPARAHASCYVSFDARALGPIQVDGFMEASMALKENDARRISGANNDDNNNDNNNDKKDEWLEGENKAHGAHKTQKGGSKKKRSKKKKGSHKKKKQQHKPKKPDTTISDIDSFEVTNRLRHVNQSREQERLRKKQQSLIKTLTVFDKETLKGWVSAPPSLSKNIFRLRLRAATICPVLEWDRKVGPEGTVLHYIAHSPTVNLDYYRNTYFLDWKQQEIMELVERGDMRDPARPPSPINGVPYREKAKDRKKRLAREAQEALEEKQSYLRKAETVSKQLPLTNRTSTELSFQLYCDPPDRFTLGHYASATTGKVTGQTAPVPADKPLSVKPGESIVTTVSFVPPPPSDPDQWPLLRTQKITGNLCIKYLNGFLQQIPLSSMLLRPLLSVSPAFYDFRHVHATSEITLGVSNNKRQVTFTLTNASDTPAGWSLLHLPRTKGLKNVSAMDPRVLATQTNAEYEERYHWTDNPAVFKFDKESGTIPPQQTAQVVVTFMPQALDDYDSKFRFVVPFCANEEDGKEIPLATVELLGSGEYGELGDADYDFHH